MINDVTGGNYVITASTNTLTDVRKYTASSFYNWEQDNIPINDLETRTNSLGASIGLTAAGIAGATLVLSSTADNDNSVYDNIDDIVTRIPKVLTFPLLVEICSYGDLGDLKLEGITIKGDGKLEFINRNHAASIYGDSYDSSVVDIANNTSFPWADGVNMITEFKSQGLYTTISSAESARHSISCYSESLWNQNVRAFGTKHSSTNYNFNEPFFFTSGTQDFVNGSNYLFSGTSYDATKDVTVSADANPYEFGTSSQLRMRDNNYLSEPSTLYSPENMVSPVYAYANYFTSVKVENCKGEQIQLKGICVDGADITASPLTHTTDVGFDIQNSDVVLTSCAAFRNRDAGFKITNSNILIEGGIVGYRNYPLDGNSRGVTEYSDFDLWDLDSNGNGFEASRSTIRFDEDYNDANVSSTSNLGKHGFMMMSNGGYGWILDKCKVIGGVGGHNSSEEQGAGHYDFQTTQLISAFNNLDGFNIDSSQVKYKGILRSQGNDINGITISNSKVGAMGVISEVNNNIGLEIESSQFTYNIGAGKFSTGYDTDASAWGNRAGHSDKTPAVCVDENGTHNIKITNNSKFSDNRISNSGRRAGLIGGRYDTTNTFAMKASNGSIVDSANVSDFEKGNLPLILVSNNSYARLLGLAAHGDCTDGAGGASYHPSGSVAGRVLLVEDNSNVDLYGTSAWSTLITERQHINDINDLKHSWTKSAIHADSNSKIRISGPTKIAGFGVAAMVDNGSKLEIGPALSEGGQPDTSLDPADPNGHSLVELQSTRACLVANNKSTLELVKCGAPITGTTSINKTEELLDRDTYHSNSFIQFYPHGFTEEVYSTSGGKGNDIDFKDKLSPAGFGLRTEPGINSASTPDRTDHNAVSTGGMCVRATGGSNVLVDQVNFEVHMNASDLSGAYYNIDGSGNEGDGIYTGSGGDVPIEDSMGTITDHYAGSQIFMWNIADTSRIIASNLLVNGVDPSAAGFHGPPGRWGSFDAGMGSEQSLGALDYYGTNGAYSTETGAAIGFYNYGPFRLLTGISSDLMSYAEGVEAPNNLTYTPNYYAASLGGNPIAQLNAQGYPGPGYTASSVPGSDYRNHSSIEQNNQHSYSDWGQPIFGARGGVDSTDETGGDTRHLIANPMIQDASTRGNGTWTQLFPLFPIPPIHMEWQGYLRNFLDESAADTFANAKHGASKMIKLCSIFRSHTDPLTGGEGRDGSGDYTFGKGVRSLNMFDLNKLI